MKKLVIKNFPQKSHHYFINNCAITTDISQIVRWNILIFFFLVSLTGCKDELFIENESTPISTRAIPTPEFDWENCDWMPTPKGQSPIPSPWVGQGSIVSVYGIDVVNDRKASDGWLLLYNSFNSTATGPLINPYFILYNKHRGLMRIFLYTTTPFISPSTYIQDGLSITSSGYKSSMLNFMGEYIIDTDKPKQTYSQMQPAPDDGSLPLASNKWYMVQYELAYDKGISKLPYNSIQMAWYMNYHNVEKIKLGGDLVGTIKGTIGSSSENNIFSNLGKAVGDVAKVAGTGVVAGLGENFLTKNTINEDTGQNKLGLPNSIFKAALKGIRSAITNSANGLPGQIIGIFSAMFKKGESPQLVSLNIKANINLEGTGLNSGSFPSSPTSFWMPGTSIPPTAIGYLPLYNESLGIFNFVKGNITITGKRDIRILNVVDEGETVINETVSFYPRDFSQYLEFNPSIRDIVNIKIQKQELLIFVEDKARSVTTNAKVEEFGDEKGYVDPNEIKCGLYFGQSSPEEVPPFDEKPFKCAVRFTLLIEPHDGAAATVVTKTFLLNPIYSITENVYIRH